MKKQEIRDMVGKTVRLRPIARAHRRTPKDEIELSNVRTPHSFRWESTTSRNTRQPLPDQMGSCCQKVR